MKHVYQRPETVGLYEESHYIDEEIKKQIANVIVGLFCTNTKRLKILDAGIGGGRLILLPLLDAALENNIGLEIIGIDNSEPMIEDLSSNLTDKYSISCQKNIGNSIWLSASINNSSIKVYNYDLENHESISGLDGQFDAVISVLTLHHLKNWRLALYSLAKTLKKDGYLILFEWTKGIKLRDGNFVDSTGRIDPFKGIDEQVVNFWKFFYKERDRYHQWFPEIMASDYSKINDVLKEPFFKPIKKDNGEDFDYTWKERKGVTWDTLRSWIEKRAYSNFHRGLSESEHSELLEWINNYLSKNIQNSNNPTNEILGCRLRIFKKICDLSDFERSTILNSIIESSLYEKLIYEKYEKKGKNNDQRPLTNLAISLIQHDAITNNTSFFTINIWDILIDSWHKEDKPLVFNRGFFDDEDKFYQHVASVLLYYAIVEKYEDKKLISGTKFIFREISEKPIITIHKTNGQKISRFFIRNIRTKTVKILLPETLLLKNDYLKNLINSAIEKVKCLSNEVWKPFKEDTWNLIYNHQEVTSLLNELKGLIDTKNPFNSIDSAVFKCFLKDLKECFYIDPKLIQPPKEEQIVKFCNALAFHLLITNWDSMIYVPSEVLLQDEKGEKYPFGFGGLILAEENKDDKTLKYYLSKRAEMLRIAINMKFRAIGAGQWAEKMAKEVEKKVNLLEQTYHDINRRYIPPIKNYNKTNSLAGLLEDKISYLRLLAQENKEQTSPPIDIKEEIKKIFNLLCFEDKDKLRLNVGGLDSKLQLRGNKGAFISLFENLIGNTCRHALSRKMSCVKIQINSENKTIFYKDNGQGFPKTIDGIDILEKINQWFNSQFSEEDMKQREEGKNIRGMGHYIVKKAADFLGWEIIPSKSNDLTADDRVQIIFEIKEKQHEQIGNIY